MHALRDAQGDALEVGGYEPAHHVVEAIAPWFAKRIEAPRWAIFTPERSVRCEGGRLHFRHLHAIPQVPGTHGAQADVTDRNPVVRALHVAGEERSGECCGGRRQDVAPGNRGLEIHTASIIPQNRT